MLKPGGRFAVCTSAMIQTLDPSVQWPLCMRLFTELEQLAPACVSAGFEHVAVDTSDSAMAFPLYDDATGEEISPTEEAPAPQEAEAEAPPRRNRVHVGSKEFAHLGKFDVNELCARVVVTGRKPL